MKRFQPPNEVYILFREVHRMHKNAIRTAMTQRGLQNVGQPKVILLLASLQEGGITQLELANAIGISSSTMTASLKSLERQGYVARRTDCQDARCKRVVITDKGLAAVNDCRQAIDDVDNQLLSGFSPEEVDTVRRYFRRMMQNLESIGGNQNPEGCFAPPPFISIGKEENE